LAIEWIEGEVVRICVNEWLKRRKDAGVKEDLWEWWFVHSACLLEIEVKKRC